MLHHDILERALRWCDGIHLGSTMRCDVKLLRRWQDRFDVSGHVEVQVIYSMFVVVRDSVKGCVLDCFDFFFPKECNEKIALPLANYARAYLLHLPAGYHVKKGLSLSLSNNSRGVKCTNLHVKNRLT